jgi:mono/diheme cytochrome c family protein
MHTILDDGVVRVSVWLCVSACLLALTACSGSSTTSGSARPPQPEGTAVPATANKLDMDQIFPPGEGRDLVLNNCQNCHTFVPIVVLQMDKSQWERSSLDHRERVTTLTDEEFRKLYEYLTTNFHPGRPVPTLPQELLDTWTTY